MGRRLIGWDVRVILMAGLALALTADARAAGDWEWTEGQGWMMGAGVSRPTPKEQLHYAYELEQKGEFMDSARQYFLLVQNFPNSEEAGVGLQRLARCLFEMENYYTSYKAIEQVIKTYPNTGRMSDLVEIELRIAKRLMLSQTPDILSENADPNQTRIANVRRALEIIDSVVDHDPYGPVAAEAYLVKGEGNLFIGEINTARTAFQTVTDDFPRSDYVERARLGVLRCDSLVGQAKPRELMDQMDVVREEEKRRHEEGTGSFDEFDEVDESFRQLAEVEAAKMMDQAHQYERMGTRSAVKAAEFLYKEIVRRYPGTPQAEDAMSKVGSIKMPKEQGRIASAIKNINLNPFTWNKDPEPPWIVPQMDPEDQVLVDAGLGPIVGVPETAPPPTAGSAGVRPAALDESAGALASGGLGYSPASAAPTQAPAFIDGVSGPQVYTSAPSPGGFSPAPAPLAPGLAELEPSRSTFANNPLPTVSESDLVELGGGGAIASVGPAATTYPAVPSPAPVYQTSPLPDLGPGYGSGQPASLGGLEYNAPNSDLIGPARREGNYDMPAPVYSTQNAPMQPTGSYYDPHTQTTVPVYADPGYAQPSYPNQPGGTWTMGDDFR